MNRGRRNLVVLASGALFGFGLAYSHMARPEVVLDFLQFDDLGLLLVMAGAAAVTGIVFWALSRAGGKAPFTGAPYTLRRKSLDRNVLLGGGIFGVGWGLSGICPGAAFASLGLGNWPILIGIAGMFAGAYAQGWIRSRAQSTEATGEETIDELSC